MTNAPAKAVAAQHLLDAFDAHSARQWSNATFEPQVAGEASATLEGRLTVEWELSLSLHWTNYAVGPAPWQRGARPAADQAAVQAELESNLAGDPLSILSWKHGKQNFWGFHAGAGELGVFQLHLEAEEPCKTCGGAACLTCNRCYGKGIHACTCHYGKNICGNCGGLRVVVRPGNMRETCGVCAGSGQTHCWTCTGTGSVRCQGCAGGGTVRCNTCDATGWFHAIGRYAVNGSTKGAMGLAVNTDSQRAWFKLIPVSSVPGAVALDQWEVVTNQESKVSLRAKFKAIMSEGTISIDGSEHIPCAAFGEPPIFLVPKELKLKANAADVRASSNRVSSPMQCFADGFLGRPFQSPARWGGVLERMGMRKSWHASMLSGDSDRATALIERDIERRWLQALRAHATARKIRLVMVAAALIAGLKLALEVAIPLGVQKGVLSSTWLLQLQWPEWGPAVLAAGLIVLILRRSKTDSGYLFDRHNYRAYGTVMLPFLAAAAYVIYATFR